MGFTNRLAALIAIAVLALTAATALEAQAPANEQIRFQGRLTDPAGAPITTGRNVTFRLYTSPTSVTPLWTESQTVVPSATGVFTVQLGAVTNFTGVNFGAPLYLGITIDTDSEMAPRYLLSASAVSHHARNAASLGGQPASAYALLNGATFTGNVTAPSFIGNLSGNVSGTAAGFTGSLGGDVTGTQNSTVVSSVGGVTAANVASGANLANAATSANTSNQIVRRDGSGNFSAGTVTANTFVGNLTGNATTATSAGSFSGTLSGDVTGTQSATSIASVGGVTAANVASGANLANAATASNTGNQIVRRDGTGNFAAGTITATTFVGNLTGTASSATQAANANQLLGATWDAPQAIGGGTAAAGTFTTLNAGTISVAGSSLFSSPTVIGPSASYRAHEFVAAVQDGGTSNSRGLQSSITATGVPGTGTISGGIVSASNVGQATQGVQGIAEYTGTAVNPIEHFVTGMAGDARVTSGSAGILAMGVYGRAQDAQVGSNVGLFGVGRGSAGRNLGSFLVANASDVDQALFSMSLPGTMSASALIFNSATGANDYGLHVNAANNLITGNLTVTGTLTASITGTADNANNLGGLAPSHYLDLGNHTGLLPSASLAGTYGGVLNFSNSGNVFVGDGAGLANVDASLLGGLASSAFLHVANDLSDLNDAAAARGNLGLGSMALEDVGNYYDSVQTDGAISTAIGLLNLDTMSQEDAADYYTSVQTDGAISTAIGLLNLDTMSQEDAADYYTSVQTDGAINTAIGLLNLDTMSQENAADYTPTAGFGSMAFEDATDYTPTAGFGSMAFQDATNVNVSGGAISGISSLGVIGGSSFIAPNALAPATPSYSAHSFEASVESNATVPSRSLFSKMTGVDAGTREVTGAWLEAVSDGDSTQGVFGQAWYTGDGTVGHVAIGLDGRARTGAGTGPGNSVVAIGTAGRADDTQGGSNIGVHAWARNGDKTSGLFAIANADETAQFLHGAGLPSGFSAAVLGLNPQGGSNDYGLHITAPNNVIDGDLTVTGTINAPIAGAVSADNITDGNLSLATGSITLGSGTFNGDGSGLASVNAAQLGGLASSAFLQGANNLSDLSDAAAARGNLGLGTMALESTANYYTTAGTDAAIATELSAYTPTANFGSMAFEDALDYYTSLQTDAAIAAELANYTETSLLGDLAFQSSTAVNITGGSISGVNGSFTDLSSSNGMSITGRSTINATSIANNNALTMNLLLDSAPGGSDAAGESGQGINVLATTGANAQRAIAVRGRVEDSVATINPRQIHSMVGVARTVGGENTSAAGAYFNGFALSGMTDGILSLSGVAADASVQSGANFTADSLLIGGRFGADSSNAGDGSAFGVLGTALGTNLRNGSNTGVLGWAAGANPSNVGVFGVANADQAQIGAIGATNPNAGMYAYNPLFTGNNYAVQGDGRSLFVAPEGNTGGYVGHAFAASATGAIDSAPAAAVSVQMTGSGITPGAATFPRDVVAGLFHTANDGDKTQGVAGLAQFTGNADPGFFAVGVAGRAEQAGSGSLLAVGVSGSVVEPNANGGSVGVHAYALNPEPTGTHAGLSVFANADLPEQFIFQGQAAADNFRSAAVFGHNPSLDPNHYGLYIGAENNKIIGDLEVTGDIIANIVASDTLLFDGQNSAFYLDASNINAGTLDDDFLSSNVPLLDAANLNFTGDITAGSFIGNLLGNAASATLAADSSLFGGNAPAHYLARANHTGALPDDALTGIYSNALTLSNIGNNIFGSFTGNLAGNADTATNAANADALGGIAASLYYTADETDNAIDAAILAQGLGTMATQDADAVNITGGSGSFTSLSSSGGISVTGAGSLTAASAPNLNAWEFNASLGGGTSAGDLAGETGQGLNVLATTASDVERGIALRGRLSDNHGSSTALRQLRGVSGVVNTDGGANTSVLGGYFFSRANSTTTAGLASLTGVAADAQIDTGATGFNPLTQRVVGGRFGVTDLANTQISAIGAMGAIINDDATWTGTATPARDGASTGVFGFATGSTTSNVGIFGGANATLAEVGLAAAANPNAGVYAFNPNLDGNNYALVADGRSSFSAPLNTSPALNYRAHSFESSVSDSGGNAPSGLYSKITATNAGTFGGGGTTEVSGAWLEAEGDGSITQGAYGLARYTGTGGTAADRWVMGVLGYTQIDNPAEEAFAMGLAGNSESPQTGANVGVYARGAGATGSTGRNIGLLSFANASVGQQTTFSGLLPTDISAAMVGYNSATGSSAYGLYVEGANNRIVGDLEVTGSINASITGTAADSALLGGELPAFYRDASNINAGTLSLLHGGTGATTAAGARTNLELGTLAIQDANTVAITGGTLDGVNIGTSTPGIGHFTTLSALGPVSFGSLTVTPGGSVNLPDNSISDLALSGNVALRNQANTFTGLTTADGGLTVAGVLTLPANSVADAALSAGANTAITEVANATSTDAGDTLVRRDSSGNFSANAITAAAMAPVELHGAGAGRFADRIVIGSATATVTIANALVDTGSIVVASLNSPTSTVSVTGVEPGAGTITVRLSGNAAATDEISYIIVNP